MAEIELYRSPISYKKANGDEWDEVFAEYSYLYDEESDRIIEVRRHGRHNARDPSVNYEDSQRRRYRQKSKLRVFVLVFWAIAMICLYCFDF